MRRMDAVSHRIADRRAAADRDEEPRLSERLQARPHLRQRLFELAADEDLAVPFRLFVADARGVGHVSRQLHGAAGALQTLAIGADDDEGSRGRISWTAQPIR